MSTWHYVLPNIQVMCPYASTIRRGSGDRWSSPRPRSAEAQKNALQRYKHMFAFFLWQKKVLALKCGCVSNIHLCQWLYHLACLLSQIVQCNTAIPANSGVRQINRKLTSRITSECLNARRADGQYVKQRRERQDTRGFSSQWSIHGVITLSLRWFVRHLQSVELPQSKLRHIYVE